MSVIFSQSLILSPGGLDLNAPVIGWRNLTTFTNVSADSEDPLFPAVMMANDATIYKWKSLITTVQYVTVDILPDEPVDYVGIARHNLGSGKIKVSVQALIGGIWTEVFPEISPGTDKPLLLRFPSVPTSEGVRLRLDGTAAAVPVAPTIAVLYVGRLTVMQRRIYVGHTPLPYGRDEEFTNGEAENGDFQGRISLKKKLSTSVSLQNLTPSWYRTELDPFFDTGKDHGFFFAWRPLTYSTEVGYAWLTNSPKPVNQRSNGMVQTTLQMGGLIL